MSAYDSYEQEKPYRPYQQWAFVGLREATAEDQELAAFMNAHIDVGHIDFPKVTKGEPLAIIATKDNTTRTYNTEELTNIFMSSGEAASGYKEHQLGALRQAAAALGVAPALKP